MFATINFNSMVKLVILCFIAFFNACNVDKKSEAINTLKN